MCDRMVLWHKSLRKKFVVHQEDTLFMFGKWFVYSKLMFGYFKIYIILIFAEQILWLLSRKV